MPTSISKHSVSTYALKLCYFLLSYFLEGVDNVAFNGGCWGRKKIADVNVTLINEYTDGPVSSERTSYIYIGPTANERPI